MAWKVGGGRKRRRNVPKCGEARRTDTAVRRHERLRGLIMGKRTVDVKSEKRRFARSRSGGSWGSGPGRCRAMRRAPPFMTS